MDSYHLTDDIVQYRREIPHVFDDALTYLEQIHVIANLIDKVWQYIQTQNLPGLWDAVKELQSEMKKFLEGAYNDYYKEQVAKWIADNLEYIFTKVVRQVFFGLTLDGNFVAYIPESWDEVNFSTGYDYTLDSYGCLMLYWTGPYESKAFQEGEKVRP